MSSGTSDAERLRLLSSCDPIRAWSSCRERRRCVICERVFTGDEVLVKSNRQRTVRLECPTRGCHTGPELWVHPGDPLVSDEAWRDWERVLRMVDGEPAQEGNGSSEPTLMREETAFGTTRRVPGLGRRLEEGN